jgi:hypothetical protein
MATPSTEDLETFLRRQDAEDLLTVLLELASDHEAVRARLARMQLADRPEKLAAAFKKTLSGWRCSTTFYGNREAGEVGRKASFWTQVNERRRDRALQQGRLRREKPFREGSDGECEAESRDRRLPGRARIASG